jgi:hypothetical protein
VVGIDFIAGNVAKHPKIPVVFYWTVPYAATIPTSRSSSVTTGISQIRLLGWAQRKKWSGVRSGDSDCQAITAFNNLPITKYCVQMVSHSVRRIGTGLRHAGTYFRSRRTDYNFHLNKTFPISNCSTSTPHPHLQPSKVCKTYSATLCILWRFSVR